MSFMRWYVFRVTMCKKSEIPHPSLSRFILSLLTRRSFWFDFGELKWSNIVGTVSSFNLYLLTSVSSSCYREVTIGFTFTIEHSHDFEHVAHEKEKVVNKKLKLKWQNNRMVMGLKVVWKYCVESSGTRFLCFESVIH